MKFSLLTLMPLLALVQADPPFPDPNAKSADFGLYNVKEYQPECVEAHCHAGLNGIDVFAGSFSNRCSTGQNYQAYDDNGEPSTGIGSHINFKNGICGSKPLACQRDGSQLTCKYNDGGAVAAKCVDADRSHGVSLQACHDGFEGLDSWTTGAICNSDGSFHC